MYQTKNFESVTMSASYHLGISCFFHDSAVSLVDDAGKIIFCMQEERLSRVKHDSRFPYLALANLKKAVPDIVKKPLIVSFYENPHKKRHRQLFNLLEWGKNSKTAYDFSKKLVVPRNEFAEIERAVRQVLGVRI